MTAGKLAPLGGPVQVILDRSWPGQHDEGAARVSHGPPPDNGIPRPPAGPDSGSNPTPDCHSPYMASGERLIPESMSILIPSELSGAESQSWTPRRLVRRAR